jgi:uncharacterized protein YjiS (DUF1127 family)
MGSSRPAILIAGQIATAEKRSCRQSDSTSRRTATASGNYDRGETQRLFWGTRFWRWCARCSARSRQREVLSTLDDRLLEDIGVTQQQANAEAAKPFWR